MGGYAADADNVDEDNVRGGGGIVAPADIDADDDREGFVAVVELIPCPWLWALSCAEAAVIKFCPASDN